MAAFAVQAAARLSVICFEAHSMRFTVVTTGRFRLGRAFGFGLAAFFPDPAFGREQSNSTGGTRTRVATSFTGAHPKSEVQMTNDERMSKPEVRNRLGQRV